MRRAAYGCALAALAVAACSRAPTPPPAPAVTVRLSTENADGNAPAVAAFFRRTCLDASADAAAFAAALGGAGWAHEQVQVASSVMPIEAWRLDHGELVRSEVSLGPGANFIDCQLTLDAEVAPSLARMRDAIRPMLRHSSLRETSGGAAEAKWQWRAGPREERDLTIGAAPAGRGQGGNQGRAGLAIHFGSSESPPPPPIRDGDESENANVQ